MLSRNVRTFAAIATVALNLSFQSLSARAATTIYFTDAVGNIKKVNSDRTGQAVVASYSLSDTFGGPHPSYLLHGGRRWFVLLVWRAPERTMMDIVFKSDNGLTISYPMDPDIDNGAQEGPARWVPGDSEISFTGTSAGSGLTGVFAMPVIFDAAGVPSIGPPYLKMASPSYFDPDWGMNLPVVTGFDWSPGGQAVVFRSNGSLPSGVYTLNTGGTMLQVWSGASSDATWGITNRLCLSTATNTLLTMNTDGSGRTQIVKLSGKNTLSGGHWSPDAALIVFTQSTPKGSELDTVAASGGAISKLITGGGSVIGWR